MTTIRLMHAKLHQVTVTRANPDYMGSITIDRDLMDQVGIFPLEEVHIYNSNNGHRFSTYALPGEVGSRSIEINGAAAHLCAVGDRVIIVAFAERDRAEVLVTGHQATVFISDPDNQCQDLLVQQIIPNREQETLDFHTQSLIPIVPLTPITPVTSEPSLPLPQNHDPEEDDELLDRGIETNPPPHLYP